MPNPQPYRVDQPSREEVDALPGATVLEFGTDWCGFCIGAQNIIGAALSSNAPQQHWKIEDGPGRALGRSYRVKLWPTLVFLKDGIEVERVVRPTEEKQLRDALQKITG